MDYEQIGRFQEAVAALEKGAALAERDPIAIAMLGHAYGATGRVDEARQILHELLEIRRRGYLSPFWAACVHMGLGETERALELLKAAYEERAAYVNLLGFHPHFDPLRSDARFREILRKMNIPV
jgi:tetratricopeptide (TPR) repeat protein